MARITRSHGTANKRIEIVVGAVEKLRADGHDLRLVVVGSDPYGLLAAATEGRADGVVHRERVSEAELAGLYRNAAAYVTASAYEGFGLPVLEAQMLGVPVISSQGGALPEVAGFGAHYPPAVDASTFATSIAMAVVIGPKSNWAIQTVTTVRTSSAPKTAP